MLCFVLSWVLIIASVQILDAKAQKLELPIIYDITPNTGFADKQTDVVITGEGFTPDSSAVLNGIPLLDIIFVDDTTLQATVPFGLSTGVYTLAVFNPTEGILENAFTVEEGTVGWASGGPYGGMTRDLVINPNDTDTVFVAVELAGLFRSNDGGANWDHVFFSSATPTGFVEIMPGETPSIFFGGEDGLYRSDQNGDIGSWTRVDINEAESQQPNALAISSNTPYSMYCAIGSTLFFTNDNGENWIERNHGLPGAPWRLAVSHEDSQTVYASFQDGTLYKTENAGLEWKLLDHSFPETPDGEGGIRVITTDPYQENTVWIGTWMQGLHRSIDGGEIFSKVESLGVIGDQSGFWSISFDPNADRIFIGVSGPNDALYYSDNRGDSWTGLGLNNQGGADIAITPGDRNTIYTSWAGIRKTINGGLDWEWLSNGIASVRLWEIAVSPNDAQRVIAVADSDGAFGTQNNGNEWISYHDLINVSHQYQTAAFDPIMSNIAYIGGTDKVLKTINDGQTWEETEAMPLINGWEPGTYRARPLSLAVHPQSNTTIYAGVQFFSVTSETINEGAVYQSTNGGESWELLQNMGHPIHQVVVSKKDPNILYLGTGCESHSCTGDGIWRSDDGGQTWEHPQSELSGLSTFALAVHPDDSNILLAGVWSGANTGQGIYRSIDGGDSWVQTNSNGLRVTEIVYDSNTPSIVYAATLEGLLVSFNEGILWQAYPGPMGQLPITALSISEGEEKVLLYVGTVGGRIVDLESADLKYFEENVLDAGVYLGKNEWTFIHLPIIISGH